MGVNHMSERLNVGIVGIGMVGQRFITLLDNHPYFKITALAATPRSAGKKFTDAIEGRWKMEGPVPEEVKNIVVSDASEVEKVVSMCDFIFCAIETDKEETKRIEEAYAKAGVPVVSNNSACRGIDDVPMLIAEINASHMEAIETQKKRLGTKTGFIVVKPNCSIQSYVPMLTPLLSYGLKEVVISTYQAISGASKSLDEAPEIIDNVIPYIGGEEEKSEKEPLKIWGNVKDGKIVNATSPLITSQCVRIPVSDGHLATVFIKFNDSKNKPSKEEIINLWNNFKGLPQELNLPSAPKQFIKYFEEDNRPQTRLDRDLENGMAITAGRLREDNIFDYKFVGLSHNTLRGAAGGGVLSAELLYRQGYITKK
jgi:aspartate-semialdehyde dehydrogenase